MVVALLLAAVVSVASATPPSAPTREQYRGAEPARGTPTGLPLSYDWRRLTALVEGSVEQLGLPGASLLLIKDDQVIYQRAFGGYDLGQVVPIASASKWLTAATLMALVDDGRIGLDDPVSYYLPAFRGRAGMITIRQLLSHTSGLYPEPWCLGVESTTLPQCVESIAKMDVLFEPGTQFCYGGGSFQVAGRIAEIATGKAWSAVFEEEIKGPLHMESTIYQSEGNPNVGGGAISTLRDYGNFLHMLLDGGTFESRPVLSAWAIREMEANQTGDLPIAVSVHQDGRRYGLGAWRDRVNEQGQALQLSSQGDTGFSPWIDRERHLCGVFLTDAGLGNVYALVERIQEMTRQIVDAQE